MSCWSPRWIAGREDFAGRPLGSEVWPPRRSPLNDRDAVPVDDRLDADLMERVGRDSLLDSLLAVGADRGDIDRRRPGHRHIESGPSPVGLLERIHESIRSASSVSGRACLAVRVDVAGGEACAVEPAQEPLDLGRCDLGQPTIAEGPHDARQSLSSVSRPRTRRREDRVVVAQRRGWSRFVCSACSRHAATASANVAGQSGRAAASSRSVSSISAAVRLHPGPAKPPIALPPGRVARIRYWLLIPLAYGAKIKPEFEARPSVVVAAHRAPSSNATTATDPRAHG